MVNNQVLKEYMQDLKIDLIKKREDLLTFEETVRRCLTRQDEREQFEAQRLQEEIRHEINQLQQFPRDTFNETQESNKIE